MWSLGIELGSFRRATNALNCWTISPAPNCLFWVNPTHIPDAPGGLKVNTHRNYTYSAFEVPDPIYQLNEGCMEGMLMRDMRHHSLQNMAECLTRGVRLSSRMSLWLLPTPTSLHYLLPEEEMQDTLLRVLIDCLRLSALWVKNRDSVPVCALAHVSSQAERALVFQLFLFFTVPFISF